MNIKLLKEPFGGMTQWIYQRFTALFMTIYFFIMGILIISHSTFDYLSWTYLFDSFFVKISTFIFFCLMFFHAWIGILHVTEDYIKCSSIRRSINFCFFLAIVFQLFILSYYLIGWLEWLLNTLHLIQLSLVEVEQA